MIPKKLDFLRDHLGLLLLWPILAILVGAAAWYTILSNLEADRQHLERNVLRETEVLSNAYSGHIERILESIDQILLHVKFEWELSNGRLDLLEVTKRGLFPPSSYFTVGIIDSAGKVVTSTARQAIGLRVADRPYFRVQRDATGDELYIGGPAIARGTGRDVVHFSRRLTHPDGSFAGVVLISLLPAYLTADYDFTTFGNNGFLSIIAEDGTILVARSGETLYPPDTLVLHATPYFPAENGSILLEGDEWFTDHRSRYVGWHSVRGYPVTALTGLDQQDVLADYWHNRAAIIHDATMATIGLAVCTLIVMALTVSLAWRKRQLRLTQHTYRMATEGGNEGFYIARPIHDARNAIIDFEMIDANERGADFFGLRRVELVGNRISALYARGDPGVMMQWLQRAMRDGVAEGEVNVPEGSPFRASWLYVRAMRSGGDLALTVRDISEAKSHVEELERRSNEDALTGLPNRHWAQAYLSRAIKRAASDNTMMAILFIDLDGFKMVNDTLGHAAGDELLRIAARRLEDAVRPHDKVVRLGGDEFVVFIDHVEHKTDAAHVAERILHAFREGFRLAEGMQAVGASIGISVFPFDGADAQALLKNADIAMYSVKTAGKGDFRFYDQKFYESLRTRHEQQHELRRAIARDEFVMYYQPRVEISSGRTSSMEALVRWAHPSRGLLDPLHFIPLAEETGLILGLGELIIDKVCAQLASWGSKGRKLVPVSVNVSPRQFNEADIARILEAAIKRHGIDPALLEVEVTESSMMGQSGHVAHSLVALQRMGITLLVDDFGTGYSSLSQLQRLDFDVLKVDRAFTAELEKTGQGHVFFTAIITMAHALGMRVVAEGVETAAQVQILRSLDCDEVQGYYVSRPLPPDDTQPVLPTMSLPSER